MSGNPARILSLCLVAGLGLAACADESTEAGGTEASEGPGDALVVWTYYTSEGQIAALEEQNALWEAAHPDVPVEHVQIPFDQLPSRLLATATTEDGPDVVLDNVVVDFPTLANAGVLADLTPYWEAYPDSDLFPDSATWELDGKIYNILSYTNLLGLYYNQDILDELGIQPPETLEDFDAALAAVTEDGRYQGLAQSGAPTVEGAWMVMPQLLGQGIDYCSITEEVTTPVFERLQSWSEGGTIPRETATWNQADAWQAFMSGDYAFGINGNWNLADVEGAGFTVGTTRFPAGPDGSHVFPGGEGIGIGAFSDSPDLAWEYIETAWLSPEASLINFEGSGQIPTRSDIADDPALTENELVQPFVAAASETAAWPVNPETAAMQTAFGQASSAVISGQTAPAAAAGSAVEGIETAKDQGGGDC